MRPIRVTSCALVSVLLTGCGSSLYEAPLPGGADLGDRPYEVSVRFADVLDLVPQAGVKVNDVPVGKVLRIGLAPDNATAVVTLVVNGDVRLPGNADARLRQSSLLGEKFVELAPPAAGPERGRLRDGDVIPVERTNRNPQVEEVLGALSLLLNGGGVAQLNGIVEELDRALSGNEPRIRSLLSRVDEAVTRLDAQKHDITRALDGLNRLSADLRAQTDDLNTGLDGLAPGLRVIEQQRTQLVGMLQSLDRFSQVAVSTVDASGQDLVADLEALEPTLRELAKAGTDLPKSIGYLASYPFPENAMIPLKGDFVNVDVDLDLDLTSVLGNLLNSSGPLLPVPGISDGPPPAPPEPPGLPVPGQEPAVPLTPPGDQPGGLLDDLLGGQ
ncbi:MCE family protein [Saccharopolyspora gloriosae]|uniref:Phospholipid/cholesterol/gamma-HCH transport system substrate-binding protein n=1 Tax=Saccharopolyspora gloriosae TaxID=455344 RepID=A0A840NGL1_9PSEU|nr:MCE family protein [Saccharopolyspora gloriosae]MBB5069373.1 phospholipid/cholesterol/gamma-HCH transport system substrate-binding protein [Saccharopolyspora gloriosae]